jgi:DNA-binding transcriptional ArsR family regulator
MNSESSQLKLDSLFSAMANAKRRGMISTLAYRPATISQLAEESQLSLPAIHKHIRLLEEANLIHRKKAGRTNFIALNRQSLNFAREWLMQYRTDWGSDEETLENYIASLKHGT